jgi:CheY-like chemotaxis protein
VKGYQFGQAAATRSSTVLIVDAAGVRDVYPEYLDFCGFKVLSAHGAGEALDLAQAHRPDVILVDIARMAANTGADAIRALKALAATAAIPVVALINLASSDDSEDCARRERMCTSRSHACRHRSRARSARSCSGRGDDELLR